MQKVQIELKRPPDWLLHGVKNLLFVIALLLVALPVLAKTWYVRTDGHDTAAGTNDTSDATTGAFLTVQKGLNTINSGDLLLVDDGTYPYNLSPTKNFTSETVVASTSGNRTNVILTGVSGGWDIENVANFTTYSNLTMLSHSSSVNEVLIEGNGLNDKFVKCLILSSNSLCVQVSPGYPPYTVSNVIFDSCSLSTLGTNVTSGFSVGNSSGRVCDTILITNCTVNTYFGQGISIENYVNNLNVINSTISTGGSGANSYGIYSSFTTTYSTNITIDGCNILSPVYGINIYCASNLIIRNTTAIGGSAGIRVGNGSSLYYSAILGLNGSIYNCYSVCSNTVYASAGMWVLANSFNLNIYNNTIIGGAYGLVMQSCQNCNAHNNVVYGGWNEGIDTEYDSTNNVINNNLIFVGNTNGAWGLFTLSIPGHRCYGQVFTNNWIISVNSASGAIFWSTNDSGNGICDFNTYCFNTTPNFGSVLTNADTNILPTFGVNSIEKLRSRWAAYGVPGNDAHSWYGPSLNAGFAQ
jgi:hypothetical protein